MENWLGVAINSIAEFSTFTALPSIYLTSELVNYTVTLQLGDGKLGIGDPIVFCPPQTVIGCIETSIMVPSGVPGLSSKWTTHELIII